MDESWRELNRAWWDERVPLHTGSDFYDVAGFLADPDAVTLQPFELEEVGDVAGKALVHLQCHFGLDTLSWARRGAEVTGLDFSAPAIEAAGAVAERAGIDATFVAADVYDAPAALGHRRFDVVYTGFGALNWLPDIDRWADVVAALAAPGATLYLAEFHPLHHVFGVDDLTVENPYFPNGPQRWDDEGTYADLQARTEHNVTLEWTHGLGSVVTALVRAGFTVEFLHEYDHLLFPRWPFLVKDGAAYRFPPGMPSLPMMYTLRAHRAGGPG